MILTIGHSRHSKARFLDLLQTHHVTALADVRSCPRSRFPQFNGPALKAALQEVGIEYYPRERNFGGRQASATVTYEDIARSNTFLEGIKWAIWISQHRRLVLTCSEHEPMECHRCLLIGRHLHEAGQPVGHILRDGQIETHAAFEDRLLAKTRLNADLLTPRAERLALAYRKQALRLGVGQ